MLRLLIQLKTGKPRWQWWDVVEDPRYWHPSSMTTRWNSTIMTMKYHLADGQVHLYYNRNLWDQLVWRRRWPPNGSNSSKPFPISRVSINTSSLLLILTRWSHSFRYRFWVDLVMKGFLQSNPGVDRYGRDYYSAITRDYHVRGCTPRNVQMMCMVMKMVAGVEACTSSRWEGTNTREGNSEWYTVESNGLCNELWVLARDQTPPQPRLIYDVEEIYFKKILISNQSLSDVNVKFKPIELRWSRHPILMGA